LDVKTRGTTSLKLGTAATGAPPSWSPDGRKVAFGYSDAQGPALGVVDLDGRRGLTPLRSPGLSGPAWAPVGDLIAFVGTEGTGSGVFVVKSDGSGRRLVARCSTRCALASQPWVSDGTRLVLELFGATA
ncbi:MAG: hypothetical protein ABIS47_00350, partial [Acidimicrobiales bacterium]